ncbi:MAG: hypothetical protein CVT89_07640 [Candidatus Altiarchaeales archaeon HGW-Altiarchaeales-2]|nr:MAG: hypothetical protein CVT89_07640 [Candidatus Altiarchaeales archaeon HGW-Altiarchaeales-2]
MHILALTFEYPPAQTGGLGVIVKDIYKEIWKNFGNTDEKIYVSLAMPAQGLQNGYKNISILKKETEFDVELGDRKQHIDVRLASDSLNPDIPIHLICGAELNDWQCYASLPQKIALFARAIPMFIDHLFWNHHSVDLIHINDWHCVPAGVMGKLKYAKQGKKIPVLYTIHRVGEKEAVYDVHFLNWIKFYEYENISKAAYFSGSGWGKFSIEALGCYYADKVNTVSKSYMSDVLNLNYLQSKFPENVKILKGWIELENLYKASDIFVNVPDFEPFGLTTLEAMDSGAIVIGTEVGGVRDMLIDFYWKYDFADGMKNNNVTGFFVLNDSGALANKILEVCILVKSGEILGDFGAHSEQYKKFIDSIPVEYGKLKEEILKEPFLAGIMMHNSMARAKKFSIEETAKNYVEIYKNL